MVCWISSKKKKYGTPAYLSPRVPLNDSMGQAVTQWRLLLIGFVEGGPKPNLRPKPEFVTPEAKGHA